MCVTVWSRSCPPLSMSYTYKDTMTFYRDAMKFSMKVSVKISMKFSHEQTFTSLLIMIALCSK